MRPGGHGVHATLPVMCAYLPEGHSAQLPPNPAVAVASAAERKRPRAHGWHPAPRPDQMIGNAPGGQRLGALHAVLPADGWCLPRGHARQCERAGLSPKRPGAHGRQCCASCSALCLPRGQTAHSEPRARADINLPAPHPPSESSVALLVHRKTRSSTARPAIILGLTPLGC